MNAYPTLAREIATPKLDEFFKACLNLIKPSAASSSSSSNRPLRTSLALVEAVFDAFSTLQPVYPTTCRPFNGQIRAAVRPYLSPTFSDEAQVPRSLQRAARRLAISVHCTAAGKTGPSDEWAKLATDLDVEFHQTADQVFRAVQEGWQSTQPRTPSKLSFDAPPRGPASPDQLPPWEGVRAGSDRLIGLFRFQADMLRYPTKTAVTLPVGALMDAVHRVSLISRGSKSQSWEQALETRPAVGREEKEELWSVVPSIHVAALELLLVLVRRLRHNALPLVSEALDSAMAILRSGIDNSETRQTVYRLVSELLPLAGPGMSKPTIDAMGIVMLACCRDIQQQTGYFAIAKDALTDTASSRAGADGAKKNGVTANADLFLPKQQQQRGDATPKPDELGTALTRDHRAAAETLLAGLLTHLPQRCVKPGVRALLDQTAVLAQSKEAMLASVLNPYVNEAGKSFPTILPHLSRRFPRDQGVEVLRSNIRTKAQGAGDDGVQLAATFEELDAPLEEYEEDKEGEDAESEEKEDSGVQKVDANSKRIAAVDTEMGEGEPPEKTNGPFLTREASTIEVAGGYSAAQKRKQEEAPEAETTPPLKKQEVEAGEEVSVPLITGPAHVGKQGEDADANANAGGDADASDDDGSVHLNMDLDDLEDDEDEGEEEDDREGA